MTTSVLSLRQSLQQLLGEQAVVSRDGQARYEQGYRYGKGKAAAVVRPKDVAGVKAVLNFCQARRQRLVVQGAHTGLVGAATPDDSGAQIVLSLEQLSTIKLDAMNRTATCGAGTLLSSLNAAAAESGLHLPIDLGADPSLGGMVATNTGGSRLLRYGGMREQLIGLEAVLLDAESTVISDMQGLRKNNVGLDLKQLFVGSGGKFGVVTAVQVSLQPTVRQRVTAFAIPTDMSRIPEIVSKLEACLDQFLLACEGISRTAMGAALDAHPALRRPFAELPPFALLIEAGASIPARAGLDVDVLLQNALFECLEGNDPSLSDVVIGPDAHFWALRHAISDGLKTLGRVIGFDISVRRNRLPELRSVLIACVTRFNAELLVADFGHVADGGMHFNIVVPRSIEFDCEDEALLRAIVFDTVVREFNGSFSAEHGVGPANSAQYTTYRSAVERQLIDTMASIFDPCRCLNDQTALQPTATSDE